MSCGGSIPRTSRPAAESYSGRFARDGRVGYGVVMSNLASVLDSAILLAAQAHHGQEDQQDRPYILHVLAVMNGLPDDADDAMRIAAVLHDVIEDVPAFAYRVDALLAKVADPETREAIQDALELLTRRDMNAPYLDYVRRIVESGNRIAIAVKRSDLAHNLSRLGGVQDAATRERLSRKYSGARDLLDSAAEVAIPPIRTRSR